MCILLKTGATFFWQEAIYHIHEKVHKVANTKLGISEAKVVQEAHWGSYQVFAFKSQWTSIVSAFCIYILLFYIDRRVMNN